MDALLAEIAKTWPTLAVVLALVGLGVLVVRGLFSEYRSMLAEQRSILDTMKNEVDTLRSELEIFKTENLELRTKIEEISAASKVNTEELDQVRSILIRLSGKLTAIQDATPVDLSDIRVNQRTLFHEIRELESDLDLAWQAILRVVPSLGSRIEEQVRVLKERTGEGSERKDPK